MSKFQVDFDGNVDYSVGFTGDATFDVEFTSDAEFNVDFTGEAKFEVEFALQGAQGIAGDDAHLVVYSSTDTYEQGDLVIQAVGQTVIYISQVDNNTGNALTDTDFWRASTANASVSEGFGINIVNDVVSVDSDVIADTDWVKANFETKGSTDNNLPSVDTDAAQGESKRYILEVTGEPNESTYVLTNPQSNNGSGFDADGFGLPTASQFQFRDSADTIIQDWDNVTKIQFANNNDDASFKSQIDSDTGFIYFIGDNNDNTVANHFVLFEVTARTDTDVSVTLLASSTTQDFPLTTTNNVIHVQFNTDASEINGVTHETQYDITWEDAPTEYSNLFPQNGPWLKRLAYSSSFDKSDFGFRTSDNRLIWDQENNPSPLKDAAVGFELTVKWWKGGSVDSEQSGVYQVSTADFADSPNSGLLNLSFVSGTDVLDRDGSNVTNDSDIYIFAQTMNQSHQYWFNGYDDGYVQALREAMYKGNLALIADGTWQKVVVGDLPPVPYFQKDAGTHHNITHITENGDDFTIHTPSKDVTDQIIVIDKGSDEIELGFSGNVANFPIGADTEFVAVFKNGTVTFDGTAPVRSYDDLNNFTVFIFQSANYTVKGTVSNEFHHDYTFVGVSETTGTWVSKGYVDDIRNVTNFEVWHNVAPNDGSFTYDQQGALGPQTNGQGTFYLRNPDSAFFGGNYELIISTKDSAATDWSHADRAALVTKGTVFRIVKGSVTYYCRTTGGFYQPEPGNESYNAVGFDVYHQSNDTEDDGSVATGLVDDTTTITVALQQHASPPGVYVRTKLTDTDKAYIAYNIVADQVNRRLTFEREDSDNVTFNVGQDNDTDTYVGSSITGQVITFNKGDGGTDTITLPQSDADTDDDIYVASSISGEVITFTKIGGGTDTITIPASAAHTILQGNGITVAANGDDTDTISVRLNSLGGLQFSSGELQVFVGNGIENSSSGALQVKLDGTTLQRNSNGLSVINLPADSVDLGEFNTAVGTAGQVLAINSEADSIEWVDQSSGGTPEASDFIAGANITITDSDNKVKVVASADSSPSHTILQGNGITVTAKGDDTDTIAVDADGDSITVASAGISVTAQLTVEDGSNSEDIQWNATYDTNNHLFVDTTAARFAFTSPITGTEFIQASGNTITAISVDNDTHDGATFGSLFGTVGVLQVNTANGNAVLDLPTMANVAGVVTDDGEGSTETSWAISSDAVISSTLGGSNHGDNVTSYSRSRENLTGVTVESLDSDLANLTVAQRAATYADYVTGCRYTGTSGTDSSSNSYTTIRPTWDDDTDYFRVFVSGGEEIRASVNGDAIVSRKY